MIRTDPQTLNGRKFDLVVVGGGIQGAAIAREAASQKIQTLLIEASDFAAGTSSRSSRLIHGGLRYLREGHIHLVREALHERERLLRLSPHLVRPVPMLMPFFNDGGGSRLLSFFGVHAYSLLAGRSTMPRPSSLSASAAAAAFPGLRTRGLRSAMKFYDATTSDGRLTLANVDAAARAGAAIVNHCALTGLAADGSLRLLDRLTSAEIKVHAKQVVNAAGPRADAVRRLLGHGSEDLVRTSRGSHLVLAPRAGELALAGFLPDKRIQFVIPHHDGTICGTTDVDEALTEDEPTVPSADARYLLDALGWLLDPSPQRSDVKFAYCGWRSLPARKGPPGALNREAFLVHEGLPNGELHTIVGGKLTTHRSLAERSVQQIFAIEPRTSPTRKQGLPGGDGPREVLDPLWWRHGSEAAALHALAATEPRLREPLCSHRPFLCVEAVHALREQGAVTFADLMLRRLWHTQGPCLREECLVAAHELFLRERRWSIDDDFACAALSLREEIARVTGSLRS
jgi:glycerol-3-phosphate dehydrogenase